MPVCAKCSQTQPSSEVRRTKLGAVCKDKRRCGHRLHRVLRVSGGRVAVRNTSRIADSEVDHVIRALAREVDLDRVVIHVKRHGDRRWSWGMAYKSIPDMANLNGLVRSEWRYLITVTDWQFVNVVAHEAKHIEHYRNGLYRRSRKGSGKRTMGREEACDAFGSWFAEKYKRQMAPEGTAC